MKYIILLILITGFFSNFTIMAQKKVQVEEAIYIDVSKDTLWEITALQFDKIGIWSAGVKHSKGVQLAENQAIDANEPVCNERQCVPSYKGFKETTERIIDYQPEDYHFTYQIAEGLPKMVKYATNQWLHEDQGKGTKITMSVNMELQGLMGSLMKGVMKKKMRKVLQENLEELKVYAETGKLHERKQKLNQKIAAKSN